MLWQATPAPNQPPAPLLVVQMLIAIIAAARGGLSERRITRTLCTTLWLPPRHSV
jgi:hypothetical protein